MRYLKDKIAIVTGGASGVGRSLCEQLGRNGAVVVSADMDFDSARAVALSIEKSGGNAQAARLDVSNADEVKKFIEETVAQYGRIDYLFNNAGAIVAGEATDFTYDDWMKVMDTNLYGVVNGVAATYPVMVKQGFGHIVNTASLAGLFPLSFALPYTTSKYAIVGLSHALRIEGADLGVKVTVACPSKIQNHMRISSDVSYDPEKTSELLPQGIPVEKCARIILHGVRKNKSTIVMPFSGKLLWILHRISPDLTLFLSEIITNRLRKKLEAGR